MPELAELKLTSDYVNRMSEGVIFKKIRKNPVHKGKDIEFFPDFTIKSLSRGKEIMLVLCDLETGQRSNLMMTMGMSGFFKWLDPGQIAKHSHLNFESESGSLSFIDVRRFGRWNWGNWSENRGPDPTFEFAEFCHNIYENGFGSRDFNKPIFEVLMNQKWFNGIGNYLRAEILYRIDLDPWTPAKLAISEKPEILDLCRDIPLKVYELGGGQLQDWKNPFGEVSNIMELILCYGNRNMCNVVDSNGRRFWYDSKWKKND